MNKSILDKKSYYSSLETSDALKAIVSKLEKLTPVIDNLSKTDERFSELSATFANNLASLIEIKNTLNDVAEGDKKQAEERGMKTLSNLITKRLLEIPGKIKSERFKFKIEKDRYHHKVDELTKQGFKEYEITAIIGTQPYQNEHDFYLKFIQPLEREQEALTAFKKDFPRYNQELLVGTEFENWQPDDSCPPESEEAIAA